MGSSAEGGEGPFLQCAGSLILRGRKPSHTLQVISARFCFDGLIHFCPAVTSSATSAIVTSSRPGRCDSMVLANKLKTTAIPCLGTCS